MSINSFPNLGQPERKKEETPDAVKEIKHVVDVLEAEKKRRGLNAANNNEVIANDKDADSELTIRSEPDLGKTISAVREKNREAA